MRKGVIRQFVAMPLGSGYSVEEQITGTAEHGGVQLLVHPLKESAYQPRPQRLFRASPALYDQMVAYSPSDGLDADMSLATGGYMSQEIYEDTQEFSDWDLQ
ncbi:MAG: hypothetical protein ACREMA_03300, partial [Longimicrobiales bacterium]